MSTVTVQPVILCGGAGTRLWPLSRAGFPKQFLCLTGTESLFQLAARRLVGLNADDIAVTALREDLKSAERDELVKKHGFSTYDYHE